MKLHKMIEMYLKYDNMHTNRKINAFICINNHINSFINFMLSVTPLKDLLWIYLDLKKGQSKVGSDSRGGQCPLLSAQTLTPSLSKIKIFPPILLFGSILKLGYYNEMENLKLKLCVF